MDIGIIFPYLETYGGAQIFVLECIKRWQKENDITLYSIDFNNDLFINYDVDINVKKIDIPIKNKFMNFPLLLQHKIASKYIKEHEIYNSHMFPCHSFDIDNNIWYPHEPSRILYDLKCLMDNENVPKRVLYSIATPVLRFIDKNSYNAQMCIANSNYSKDYLESIYGNIVNDVVYPGVNLDKFEKNNTNKERKKILIVSRLYKEKNIDIGIKVLNFLDESFNLSIVGTGPYKKQLKTLINNYGLNNRVNFEDFVSDEKLVSLYKEALCVIFMPFNEPFGMVVLEAMAAGTPVIGLKNGGGYTELIDNYENGFLVNENPEEIAKLILFMEENEFEYNLLVKNCKKTAKEHTWSNTSKQLMKIFENYLTSEKSI